MKIKEAEEQYLAELANAKTGDHPEAPMTAAAVESNTAPRSDARPEVIGEYQPRVGNAAGADAEAVDEHLEGGT